METGSTARSAAELRWPTIGFDGFTERGSLAPLRVKGGDEASLQTMLGFSIARDCRMGRVIIRPEAGAAWKHEFASNRYDVDAQLGSGAGGIFTARGPGIGRDGAVLNAGVSLEWSARCATYFFYDGELGRRSYDSHVISGGMRTSF